MLAAYVGLPEPEGPPEVPPRPRGRHHGYHLKRELEFDDSGDSRMSFDSEDAQQVLLHRLPTGNRHLRPMDPKERVMQRVWGAGLATVFRAHLEWHSSAMDRAWRSHGQKVPTVPFAIMEKYDLSSNYLPARWDVTSGSNKTRADVALVVSGLVRSGSIPLTGLVDLMKQCMRIPCFRKRHGWNLIRGVHLAANEEGSPEPTPGVFPEWLTRMYVPRPYAVEEISQDSQSSFSEDDESTPSLSHSASSSAEYFHSSGRSSNLGLFSSDSKDTPPSDQVLLEAIPVPGVRQLPQTSLQQTNHLIDPCKVLDEADLTAFCCTGENAPSLMVRLDSVMISFDPHCKLCIMGGCVLMFFIHAGSVQSAEHESKLMQLRMRFWRKVRTMSKQLYVHSRDYFVERCAADFGIEYPFGRHVLNRMLVEHQMHLGLPHGDWVAMETHIDKLNLGSGGLWYPYRRSYPMSLFVISQIVRKALSNDLIHMEGLWNVTSAVSVALNKIIVKIHMQRINQKGARRIIQHLKVAATNAKEHRCLNGYVQKRREIVAHFDILKHRWRRGVDVLEALQLLAKSISRLSEYGYRRNRDGLSLFHGNGDSATTNLQWRHKLQQVVDVNEKISVLCQDIENTLEQNDRILKVYERINERTMLYVEILFMALGSGILFPGIVAGYFGMNLTHYLDNWQWNATGMPTGLANFLTATFSAAQVVSYALSIVTLVSVVFLLRSIGHRRFMWWQMIYVAPPDPEDPNE